MLIWHGLKSYAGAESQIDKNQLAVGGRFFGNLAGAGNSDAGLGRACERTG